MAVKASILSEFNDKGVKAAESAFGGMSKKVMAAGASIAAGLAVVTKGLYEIVQAAAEDEKSFTQLAQSMKNVTGASDALIASTDKQIGKMSMQVGIADDKLRPAFSNLLRATGSLSLSQKGLASATDLSVAKQIDMDAASNAVAKALAGNTTALVKMLPGLKGIIDNGSSAEEVLAAINSQVGGAAEANTKTFAGALERLKVIFGEMVETVGSWLLPALTKLADFLNTYLGVYFTYLSEVVGPKVNDLFNRMATIFREDILPVLQDYVIPAFEYLGGIYKDVILPLLQKLASVLIDKIGKAFQMIREKLDDNRDGFTKLREFMDKTVVFIERYLGPALVKLYDNYLDALIWALGKVIDAFFKLGDIVGPIMASIGRVVMGMVKGIVGGINAAIGAINAFIGIYNRLPGFLKPWGDVTPLSPIQMPTFDLTDYAKGGFGYWGDNRGDMPTGPIPGAGGIDVGGATGGTAGGRAGGRAGAGMTLDLGNQPGPSLGQGVGIGVGWDLALLPPDFLAGYDPLSNMGNITVNVEGGLATSADIGRAVVDAIKQYTNVSGPANIAIA